ncbi:LCP family protein [Paenibacillus lentus]
MSKKKKIILRIMLFLVSVIIVSTAVFTYQIKSNIDKMIIPNTKIDTALDPKIDTGIVPGQPEENNKDFYFLVLGLDYRGKHNALLTDSLMVLHIIPQESIIRLLSIPRDLLVENANGNTVKINSLFSEGYSISRQKAAEDPSILTGDTVQLGSRKLDKALLSGSMANIRNKIEELLDVEIDHTILVNFNTVISLVDEVGGIEIDVKRSMQYKATNLYLKPGLQILNGEDALGYARFREDDRGSRYFASDFERGKHQQEVVKALADEILSWKNTTKTLKLLKIVSDNVQTDMDYTDMYSMITKYYNAFNGDSISSIPFPEHYSPDGDVVLPDDARDILQDALKYVETDEVSEAEE